MMQEERLLQGQGVSFAMIWQETKSELESQE